MRKIFLLLESPMLFTIIMAFYVISGNLYGSNDQNELNAEKCHSTISNLLESACIEGTWDGSTNNKWNECTNWCNDLIPTSSTNVVIPSGVTQPTIYESATCNNITINPSATLTIADSNTLTVMGNWTNSGTFVANSSTVIYNGINQTITNRTEYNNVTISGSGSKSITSLNFIVNGILSMEGPIGVSLNNAPTYGPIATLRYISNSPRNTGNEWPATFTAKGGVIIDGIGIITTSLPKTLDESVPLLIFPGATLAINDKDITFKGNFQNNGTFNATTANITIGGTQTQSIDGFTTTGNLIINKVAGIATLTSNINANELQTTNSGTLHLGEGLTHTFTGTWKKGNSTLNGGSSKLRLGSGYDGSTGSFNANTGIVEWFSNSNQNICGLTYHKLVISGEGIKFLIGNTNITVDLTIRTEAKLDITQTALKGINTGSSLIVNGTLLVSSGFPSGFTYFNNEGGSIDYNGGTQDIKNLEYYNLILSGSSNKTFLGITTIVNKLSIKDGAKCKLNGFISSTNTLTLGDYEQVAGTWGGTGSGATYLNDYYFLRYSGKLIVNKSIVTPGLWMGTTSSDWSNASNWSDGVLPTHMTDAILTATGIDPIINNSAACANLIILPEAILTINDSFSLMVSKDWINKGTFTPNSGTVNFNGSNQLVGVGPFYNLTLSGSGLKTTSTGVHVSNILSMEGTANVSNYVLLSSTGTLQYNTPIDRLTGPEWPINTIVLSKIIINNTGVISLSGPKTMNIELPILIKEGATLNTNNYNLTSSKAINLECGGMSNGSSIIGTGSVIIKGNITVSDMGNGIAPAKILCPISLFGPLSIIVENGNTDKLTDTDLFVNNMNGSSASLYKSGEGTFYINNWAKFSNLDIIAGNVIIPIHAEVSNTVTNVRIPDGILIQSGENGTGSLITSTSSGTGTSIIQCFMTSNAWHLVAPPIDSQDIQNFLLVNESIPTNQYEERGIRDYDPVRNEWKDFFTNTTIGNIINGKGYATRVRDSKAHKVIFSGIIKAGSLSVENLSAGNWNCIGNPYTSAIAIRKGTGTNIENFLTANASNIDPAYGIYIWDRTDEYNGQSNQYTAISNVPTTGTSFPVQIGQAFMVKMASGKTAVSFTTAMQLHQPALTLKSTESVWPLIELVASADSLSSSTVIAFHDDMTNGLDPTYDAGLLSSEVALEISTRLIEDYGIPFAIQALPGNAYESTIIPVCIEYRLGGIVTISAKGIHLPIDYNAILEDKLNNTFTNLLNQNYSTNLFANSPLIGRFFLHTSYATTGIDKQINLQPIIAWVNGHNHLCIQGKVSQDAKVRLYDIQGKMILTCQLKDGNYNTIEISSLKSGIYILHIEDNNKIQALKVAFIN